LLAGDDGKLAADEGMAAAQRVGVHALSAEVCLAQLLAGHLEEMQLLAFGQLGMLQQLLPGAQVAQCLLRVGDPPWVVRHYPRPTAAGLASSSPRRQPLGNRAGSRWICSCSSGVTSMMTEG